MPVIFARTSYSVNLKTPFRLNILHDTNTDKIVKKHLSIIRMKHVKKKSQQAKNQLPVRGTRSRFEGQVERMQMPDERARGSNTSSAYCVAHSWCPSDLARLPPPSLPHLPSVCSSVCVSVRPSVCLSVHLSVCLRVRLSICLSIWVSLSVSVPP